MYICIYTKQNVLKITNNKPCYRLVSDSTINNQNKLDESWNRYKYAFWPSLENRNAWVQTLICGNGSHSAFGVQHLQQRISQFPLVLFPVRKVTFHVSNNCRYYLSWHQLWLKFRDKHKIKFVICIKMMPQYWIETRY